MADSDIMQCECGYTCRRDELQWKQTQKTRFNCEPYDDEEDWYEPLCPECGGVETMEEAEDPGVIMDSVYDTERDA
jgi:hypothetical protein